MIQQDIGYKKNWLFKGIFHIILCLVIVFIEGFFISAFCKGGFFMGILYGGPSGKGKNGNEFEMMPGLQLGFQALKPKPESFFDGVRVGIGYQKVRNKLRESSADGDIITPFFIEILDNLYNYPKNKKISGELYYSWGINWNMIKFGGGDHYDRYFPIVIGLTYNLFGDQVDISFLGRYHFYWLDAQTFDNLGQNGGWEIGLLYSF